MLTARHLWLILAIHAVTGLVRGADGWAGLKLGMSSEAAIAALGAPLIRTEGRGFEVWTYDNRAEVVFYGTVIAWTAPDSSGAAKHAAQEWQFSQGLPDRRVLPAPIRRKNTHIPRESEARVFLPVDNHGFGYRR